MRMAVLVFVDFAGIGINLMFILLWFLNSNFCFVEDFEFCDAKNLDHPFLNHAIAMHRISLHLLISYQITTTIDHYLQEQEVKLVRSSR